MRKTHVLLACVALFLQGCSTASHDTALADLRAAVGPRAGGELVTASNAETTAALLRENLSLDAALRVALLNSPRLQSIYDDAAIAAAERDGASAIANPMLSAKLLPSLSTGPATLEFGILASVIDWITQPARQTAAKASYQVAKLRSAADVAAFAVDLRRAYIGLVAAQHAEAVERELADAATASADLAQRFYDAGNLSLTRLRLEQAAKAESAADLAERTLAVDGAREALAVLMGIDASGSWRVPATLPGQPATAPAVTADASRRLDIQAAKAARDAALADLQYRSGRRLWREAGLGLVAQREGAGPWTLGPQLEFALPLFNSGGAEVARAAAIAAKAEHARADLELTAASQIRLAEATLRAAEHRVARYRDEILPLRSQVVGLKLKEYNRSYIGVFEVLLARKDAAGADLGYIGALRDYWLARAALDATLGGGTAAAPTLEGASP